MAARGRQPSLADLDNIGLRVDEMGRIQDWAGRPWTTPRPATAPVPNTTEKARRNKFTEEEESLLVSWCIAAEQEGLLVGSGVFQELECLYPAHSWPAWENKWRRGKLDAERAKAVLVLLQDRGIGLLSGGQDGQPSRGRREEEEGDDEGAAEEAAEEDAEERQMGYGDFQMQSVRNVCRALHLQDEAHFKEFLALEAVLDAYTEFDRDCLNPIRRADKAFLRSYNKLPSSKKGRAPHRWKINFAADTLLQYDDSKYLKSENDIDKKFWNADDHDIRFIARTAKSLTSPGGPWHDHVRTFGWVALCERLLFLMEWLRWVYKLSIGTSEKSEKVRQRKKDWFLYLHNLRADRTMLLQSSISSHPSILTIDERTDTTQSIEMDPAGSEVSPSTPQLDLPTTFDVRFDRRSTCSDIATDLDRPLSEVVQPTSAEVDPNLNQTAGAPAVTNWLSVANIQEPLEYSLKVSSVKNQQQGVFWLTEDAHTAYTRSRDRQLNAWGVTSGHTSTCVLVPNMWGSIDSFEVLNNPQHWPQDEQSSSRLQFHLADLGTSWARACVWYETWPRRGVDLDQFLIGPKGPYSRKHGSHLCHHGFCIVPNHLVYESGEDNNHRATCISAARVLRTYNVPIPEHCEKHTPPCLLQNAALTTTETLHLQMFVLRLAAGLQIDDESPARPAHHPSSYSTFESRLPLSMRAARLAVEQANLVHPQQTHDDNRFVERFSIRCRFCMGPQRAWKLIVGYWSHLKNMHPEQTLDDILQEIQQSARQYKSWIEQRGFNYDQGNPATWSKILQAVDDGFTWEVVRSWRLHHDRYYERVVSSPNRASLRSAL